MHGPKHSCLVGFFLSFMVLNIHLDFPTGLGQFRPSQKITNTIQEISHHSSRHKAVYNLNNEHIAGHSVHLLSVVGIHTVQEQRSQTPSTFYKH